MPNITTSAAVDEQPIEAGLSPGENLAMAMSYINLCILREDHYPKRDIQRLERILLGLKQVAGIRG